MCVVVFLQLQGGQGNIHREGLHPYSHDIIAEVYHHSAAAKVSKYQPLFIPSIEPLFTIWSRIPSLCVGNSRALPLERFDGINSS